MLNAMTPLIVLTTVGGNDNALAIAQTLVDRRVAACVNILDRIYSVYRWKGSVAEEPEKLLIIKTVDEKLEELKQELFSIHPYEVPEFVVMKIDDIGGPYRDWLVDALYPA